MRGKFIILLSLQLCLATFSFSQAKWFLVEDLQKNWLVYDGEEYKSFEDNVVNTVYFKLASSKEKDHYLSVSCKQDWSLFVNGVILGSYNTAKIFNIDSLHLKSQTSNLLIGIYKRGINPGILLTSIVSQTDPNTSIQDVKKPDTFFRDFVVIALLILLILFIVVTQLTKLNQSYFSVKRLFSSLDIDDTQQYTKVISGSNILLFIFISILLSLYLTIIFHFTTNRFDVAWVFNSTTFWEAVEQWMKLTLILFLAFILKILLVFIMSRIFDLKELLGFQIFNWVRIMLVAFGILSICLITFFLSRGVGNAVYPSFFWAITFVLIIWLIILFTRVARRLDYPMFHIISYLCATEIIPLLITVKLLYH